MIDYLVETLLIILLFIAFILYFTIGVSFWYACYPIFTIIYLVKYFNRTQEKNKYDLKFWIESLNILDAILIITYIISLSLYFAFTDLKYLCFYINIGSFVIYLINNQIKSEYFARHSIFALPYVDFNQNKKFIINKINGIVKYDLWQDDIELIKQLKDNEEMAFYYNDSNNEELKNSIYRLTRCQFVTKKEVDNNKYIISINEKLVPYLNKF